MSDHQRGLFNRKTFFLLIFAVLGFLCAYTLFGNPQLNTTHPHQHLPSKRQEPFVHIQEPDIKPEVFWREHVENRLSFRVPIEYDHRFKSPCWHEHLDYSDVHRVEDSHYLNMTVIRPYIQYKINNIARTYKDLLLRNITTVTRCLPHFHIIGQGKCGTTDLYGRLMRHPQVVMGALKEANWWSHSSAGAYKKLLRPGSVSFNSFVDLFGLAALEASTGSSETCGCKSRNGTISNNACQSLAIGDGSIETLWSPLPASTQLPPLSTIAHFMKWVLPNAKLIVILRDPTARLYSHFRFADRSGSLNQTDFHYRVVHAIRKFRSCLRDHSEQFCAYSASTWYSMKVRLHLGLYAIYLKDWLQVYDRRNMFIIRTEDYASNEKATLHQLYNFLEICEPNEDEEDFILEKPIGNPGKRNIGPMWDKTKKLLDGFYKRYNKQLAILLRDKRFLWNDT